jgi:hypothetical protein
MMTLIGIKGCKMRFIPRRIVDLTNPVPSLMSTVLEGARILSRPGSRIRAGYGPEAFYLELGIQEEVLIIKMNSAEPSDGERGSIPREGKLID